MVNKVNGKREIYVLLTDMRPCLNATDVSKDRERSRSPAGMKVDRLRPLQAKPLSVLPQINCGFPRKKKVSRAMRERERKKKKQPKDAADGSKFEQKRKRRFVPETEVDHKALASRLRQKRRKLSAQKSRTKMVKIGKDRESEVRAQQKAKEKEREAQQNELKKKQREQKRVEQRQTEKKRKEWNSGWRKLNVSRDSLCEEEHQGMCEEK